MLVRIKNQKEKIDLIQKCTKKMIDYELYQHNNEFFLYINGEIDLFENVESLQKIEQPYDYKKENIYLMDTPLFTSDNFTLIAGPCAVEDEKSLTETAEVLKKHNIKIIRGGSNKLRTSPYSFQGNGKEAVLLLAKVAKEYNLFSTTEITSIDELDLLVEYIDILLVGTRNMHNYKLLKELSKINKPIILKRGMSATIKEWLFAAEYLTQNGNRNIVLCERGIRTFNDCLRNTFDLASALYVSLNSSYHVIADPSHATGENILIEPLVLASKVAGLSGTMIEIHPNPEKALSDKNQVIDFIQFERLMTKLIHT